MTFRRESLNLTPAESLMILDPKKSSGKEMMRLTLMDLLLKKVLRADVQQLKKGKIIKKDVKETHVRKGEAFDKVKLKSHEGAFCNPLNMTDSMELTEMAKTIHEHVKGFNGYKNNYIREPLSERGFFSKEKKKRLLIPYTKYELSKKGLEARDRMQSLISEGEDHFEEWMGKDMARARAYLSVCGANIFLLANLDFETMKKWMQELSKLEYQAAAYDHYPVFWYDYDRIPAMGETPDFDFSSMDFGSLNDFDSFDDIDAGFDMVDGGDGGGMD
jgi:hypothetical protein